MYFHAVLGDGRGCMSLVSLRKSNYMFDMHTHQIPPGCGLLGRTGPRRRPSGGFRPHARQHTCTHNTGDPRAYYTSKYARTRARCTCPAAAHALASSAAGPATSCPPAARSTAASRRVAPPFAVATGTALAAARGRTAAAAAAAAAELLGSAPTMAAAADKEPVRVERETPIAAPPRSRCRPQWQTPAESSERGGVRGGLAACRRRRLVALARRCRGGWSGTLLQAVKSTVLRTTGCSRRGSDGQ